MTQRRDNKSMLSFDGSTVTSLTKNRGRTRAFLSSLLMRKLHGHFLRYIQGHKLPVPTEISEDYSLSITSWEKRTALLPLALISILEQSLRPSKILVWLTPATLKLIPPIYRERFEADGVCFNMCDDLKSHKKWLPMIEFGYSKPFVICDDDILYPKHWFRSLVAEDRLDAYVGARCHRWSRSPNGQILNYSQWEKLVRHAPEPSHDLFVTGGAGAIIHPDRIPRSFLDRGALLKLCPLGDDIWLKFAHLAADVPCFKTVYEFPCLEMPGSAQSGLLHHNVENEYNDVQIASVDRQFAPRFFLKEPSIVHG